ncbi:bifunctional enoyl-CoA hydratase/phosphate acetyltransferase [Bacillus massiliigorillae]|uniref:bifunctional enoyl-CoA hydratase/phosphate acetyltransferase n=1 Tax=Bacillus massiliigorillae TaxID=1243664 RepID=UPI0003A11718|nr:bifunctional enoyl-CoA hydratase/phosphate acetyltransferase [Bacillus massiliigorillae]
MYNTEYFVNLVKERSAKKQTVVVAAPYDEGSISAVCHAQKLGMSNAILVGDTSIIKVVANQHGFDISEMEIIDASTLEEVAVKTVQQIVNGKASVIMKGLIDTSILLSQVVKKENGLRTGKLFSHTAVIFKENSDKYFILTDAGMNIAPTVDQKKQIIENAVELAHALGNDNPNVAVLCAKEKVYDKMPATLDADQLHKMNLAGEITGCTVSGPLQIDNAVSKEAAESKGVKDPVAGKADILLVPNIEVGNIFGKGLKYIGGADITFAGVVMGPKVPIVMCSRADGEKEKLMSIALACALSAKESVKHV